MIASRLRRLGPGAAAVLALLALANPLAAQDLATLIPNLFDRDVFLKPTAPFDHSTHFIDEGDRLRAAGAAINQALVSQLSTFPLPSPSGGFTYVYESSVGGFVRASDSFGPLFAERAQTNGRGKWNVGVSFLSARYDSIDDLDLGGRELLFQLVHEDTNMDHTNTSFFFEGDVIEADTIIDLESETSTVFFNYGVTNRFDVAIAVPIVSVDLTARSVLTVHRLATGSFPTPIHIFDDDRDSREFSDQGSASGVGDVVVRGKYHFAGGRRGGWALAADVRLPTGDEQELLGTGATQTKVFVIGSSTWGRTFSPHLNLGYTFSSGSSDLVGDLPDEINYTAGFDWAVHPRVTVAIDFVGRTLQDAVRLESQTRNFAFCSQPSTAPGPPVCAPGAISTTPLPELGVFVDDLDLWLGSAGVRLNVVGNLLLSANVLFALSDEGLQDEDAIPVVSLDYSF